MARCGVSQAGDVERDETPRVDKSQSVPRTAPDSRNHRETALRARTGLSDSSIERRGNKQGANLLNWNLMRGICSRDLREQCQSGGTRVSLGSCAKWGSVYRHLESIDAISTGENVCCVRSVCCGGGCCLVVEGL